MRKHVRTPPDRREFKASNVARPSSALRNMAGGINNLVWDHRTSPHIPTVAAHILVNKLAASRGRGFPGVNIR